MKISLVILLLTLSAKTLSATQFSHLDSGKLYVFAYAYGKNNTLYITDVTTISMSSNQPKHLQSYAFENENNPRFKAYLQTHYPEAVVLTESASTLSLGTDLGQIQSDWDFKVNRNKNNVVYLHNSFIFKEISSQSRKKRKFE